VWVCFDVCQKSIELGMGDWLIRGTT
jgi:hypothetical protein